MKQPPSGYQPTGYLCGSTTSDSPPRRSTYSPGFSFPESSPSSTSSTGPTFSLSSRTMDKDTLTKILLYSYFFYADRAIFRVRLSNVYSPAMIFSQCPMQPIKKSIWRQGDWDTNWGWGPRHSVEPGCQLSGNQPVLWFIISPIALKLSNNNANFPASLQDMPLGTLLGKSS